MNEEQKAAPMKRPRKDEIVCAAKALLSEASNLRKYSAADRARTARFQGANWIPDTLARAARHDMRAAKMEKVAAWMMEQCK